MKVSVRQLIGSVVVSFCAGALITPVWTQGQGGQSPQQAPAANQPTYMIVEFMKPANGQEQAWLKLERENWKPMHELRVKNGGILSWAVIAQAVPGDESDGPTVATVTTFRGWPDPTATDWLGLLKQANPQQDAEKLMEQTGASREIVRSEIWQVLDQTTPAPTGTR